MKKFQILRPPILSKKAAGQLLDRRLHRASLGDLGICRAEFRNLTQSERLLIWIGTDFARSCEILKNRCLPKLRRRGLALVVNEPRSRLQKLLVAKLTKRGWVHFCQIVNRLVAAIERRIESLKALEELSGKRMTIPWVQYGPSDGFAGALYLL